MRSHAFRALALFCAASSLVACGESVDVGAFEDGTGGAGGGALTSTGATPNGPAGTGGGDATTTSSAGGGDPTPDNFQLVLLQQDHDAHLLAGSFVRGDYAGSVECVTEATEGGCILERCDAVDFEEQVNVDAGEATASAGDRSIDATNDENVGYFNQADGLLFEPGSVDAVNFDVEGSADVPAFDGDVAAPQVIDDVQAVVNSLHAPSGDDVTLTWTPVPAAKRLVTVQRQFTNGIYTEVMCEVTGAEGSLVIPGGLLSSGADGGTLFDSELNVQVASAGTFTSGTFEGVLGVINLTYAAKRCGGLSGDGNSECDGDELCDYPDDGCGFADGMGFCRPRPEACPFDVVDPVCSCDGEIYQSECFANLAGVDVDATSSTCNPEVRNCGGKTGLTCGDDEYCAFEGGFCGENDETGVCKPRPTTCDVEGPVSCACDGQNYPSACEAARHGADVWEGEDFCEAPKVCGGLGGLECDADEFCDYPTELCGGDDGTGVCRPRPTDCPEPGAGEAVCGCSFGDAFDSECLANMAGQDIAGGDGLECGGA